MDTSRLKRIIAAARGEEPADLCVRRCKLVNVLSGRIETVDVAVRDGVVLGWGAYQASETIDAEGMYLCPLFIDGHIHIESSMLGPAQFCAAVLPWGTGAVVADPHEIANVLGLEGIRYFLDAVRDLPLDVFFNLPSCVPATPLETAGADLRASDLRSLFPDPHLLGLAEMMNFPGVIGAVPEILDKLLLFRGSKIDGHAPQLGGMALNAYIASGIASDHECTTLAEAREKLSKGMTIMLREGSQSKDLEALHGVVDVHSWPHCMLVCDDIHPDDLLTRGHMNSVVNRAMALGMEPVRAVTLATWTAANHFRLPGLGAVAPGFAADFSLSPTLNPWTPKRVFKRGIEVAREGKLLVDPADWRQPPLPRSPMRITRLAAADLLIPAQSGRMRVIGLKEGTLLTDRLLIDPKIEDGLVVADTERDVLKLAVYNRYTPDLPPAVAFVHGTGLKQGAIATSIAHDSHNVIAVGVRDEDILYVVDALRKTGGGMAAGVHGGLIEVLPLPLAGLMSVEPVAGVAERLRGLKALVKSWGALLDNPFMALSFVALPVIPELKITDRGLVEVSKFAHVPLFEQQAERTPG